MQHSNDCCLAVNIGDETTWTFRSVNHEDMPLLRREIFRLFPHNILFSNGNNNKNNNIHIWAPRLL